MDNKNSEIIDIACVSHLKIYFSLSTYYKTSSHYISSVPRNFKSGELKVYLKYKSTSYFSYTLIKLTLN